MRVLHVAGAVDREIGGSAFAVLHAAGELRARGIDAVVASTIDRPENADYIRDLWPGLPVHAFVRRPPRHYWNSPDLRRWLQAEVPQADLVVVHGLFKIPFVVAARACVKHGIPFLVHPHNSLDPYDLRKHAGLKRIYGPLAVRRMLHASSGVVVTTSREATRLVTYGARPPIHVLPLAVPGPPTTPSPERFRQRFALPRDADVVVFLSRFDRKKGIERLLEAAKELRASRPELRLVLAGAADEAGYGTRVNRLVSRLGLDDMVTWTGFVLGDAKWDALAAADVFTLPSDNENFGIVVVEALLAGTPVVISDGVYLADELGPGGGAEVCGTDVNSLVASLDRVLGDPTLAREQARIGAAIADELCRPSTVTERTMQLYDEIVLAHRGVG